MRYFKVIIILIATTLAGCSQSNSPMQNTANFTLPQVDDQFESFDPYLHLTDKDTNNIDHSFTTEDFYYRQYGYGDGFVTLTYGHDSYFKVSKHYYADGKIKEKGVAFHTGHPIGTWYLFDESGNLAAEKDSDAGYLFTYEDVINYCINNDIPLTKGYVRGGYQTRILKQGADWKNLKNWMIDYQSAEDKTTEITLDSKTGKELNREVHDYINN